MKIRTVAVGVFLLAAGLVTAQPALQVYRDKVEPHWLPGDIRFWYRNDLTGGKREFVFVDAEKGTRAPAFDHAKVAEILSRNTGTKVEADRLPIESLEFSKDLTKVEARLRSGAFVTIDLATYTAIESKPAKAAGGEVDALKPLAAERPSRSGTEESQITFVNKSASTVRLFWVSANSKRKAYGEIAPGASQAQHTFAGHVWVVADAEGKLLGAFEAGSRPGMAVISKASPAANPDSDPERLTHADTALDNDAQGDDARVYPADTAPTAPRRDRQRPRDSSPDGKYVVVVRDSKLFVRVVATGEELALGDDGKSGDAYEPGRYWWSPDSSHLVALRTEPAQEHKVYIVEAAPKDQVQPKLRTLDYLKPGDRIAHPRPVLFDLAGKRRLAIKEDLFASPWSIQDVRWAADSSRFTFLYNQRGHQALRLIAVDATTGNASAVIVEKSNTFICYSGKSFLNWIGEEELIWMSERDGWNHLYLIDARSGRVKNSITTGPWVVQKVLRVDAEKRQIWFNAGGIRPTQDPYYTHFCRVNFDGSGLTILTEGDGTHTVQWEPGRPYFIDSWSRVDAPPVTELRRSSDGKLVVKLEEADASAVLAARGGRWPMRFIAKGRDGKTDIFGVILLPRDFDPAKKYPVVEQIYAGPQGFFVPKAFKTRYGTMQQLADRGMIAVQIDGMGTAGRSKAFHDVCFKNLKDAGFSDRKLWIQAAATTIPQMDLSRVGIYGGSAGGQNALAALLWHGDFYKVAVADCGCHDNRMDKIWWNEQWMGWPIDKSYEESSNVTNAGRLRDDAKLLLVVGEVDSNVDPASTMQVAAALQKAGKSYELLTVAGANHGAAETPYGSRRRMDFLCQHLLGSR